MEIYFLSVSEYLVKTKDYATLEAVEIGRQTRLRKLVRAMLFFPCFKAKAPKARSLSARPPALQSKQRGEGDGQGEDEGEGEDDGEVEDEDEGIG